MPSDVDQDGRDAGQCWLRCSVSSVDIDEYRLFATCRYREPSGRARFPANRKSAVRKRGPIKQFVENQWPGIGPCGLVRVPAGSCGKIRTPAGSRRNKEPNPRPQSEPDSNPLALRVWIRQFGQLPPQNPGYFRQIRWFSSPLSLYSPIAQSLNA